MLADTFGRPLRIILTAGQSGDVTAAPALLDGLRAEAVLADKAYDSNALRTLVAAMGAMVIPLNRTRKVAIPHDTEAYKHRNRGRLPSLDPLPARQRSRMILAPRR